MQFARILVFLFAALVSAVAIPGPDAWVPTSGGTTTTTTNSCSNTNSGPQTNVCCINTGGNTQSGSGGLLNLLSGNFISALNGAPLQCTTIGSGGNCNTGGKVYCCEGAKNTNGGGSLIGINANVDFSCNQVL